VQPGVKGSVATMASRFIPTIPYDQLADPLSDGLPTMTDGLGPSPNDDLTPSDKDLLGAVRAAYHALCNDVPCTQTFTLDEITSIITSRFTNRDSRQALAFILRGDSYLNIPHLTLTEFEPWNRRVDAYPRYASYISLIIDLLDPQYGSTRGMGKGKVEIPLTISRLVKYVRNVIDRALQSYFNSRGYVWNGYWGYYKADHPLFLAWCGKLPITPENIKCMGPPPFIIGRSDDVSALVKERDAHSRGGWAGIGWSKSKLINAIKELTPPGSSYPGMDVRYDPKDTDITSYYALYKNGRPSKAFYEANTTLVSKLTWHLRGSVDYYVSLYHNILSGNCASMKLCLPPNTLVQPQVLPQVPPPIIKIPNPIPPVSLSVEPIMYRHYRGGIYRVLMEAIDSETGEKMIVYVSLSNGSTYVRPASEWFTVVNYRDGMVPRFTKM
jgi:hypothetical protein